VTFTAAVAPFAVVEAAATATDVGTATIKLVRPTTRLAVVIRSLFGQLRATVLPPFERLRPP
jgi:hypothetical protein